MMTRSLVNDDDVSMMTSWNGQAARADTLGLASWRVTLALALTLAPTLAPL